MAVVSIIVPVYNTGKYLGRCLDSLIKQTFKNIEIICINDGSTDDSLEILKKYKQKYPQIIQIISKKNDGLYMARETGLEVAIGDYIAFVDSDDYVSKHYIEKLFESINKNNSDISVCGFFRVNDYNNHIFSTEMCKKNDLIIDLEKRPYEIISINTSVWNKLYKKSVICNRINLQSTPRFLEDIIFNLQIYAFTKKISFVEDPLVYYTVRKDSLINSIKQESIQLIYNSLIEMKKQYTEHNVSPMLISTLDVIAYLHIGISLTYRLSYDINNNINNIINNNKKFLDLNFPLWRNSKYLKFNFLLNNNFINWKLYLVSLLDKIGLFPLFIYTYRLMIDKFKIDIKW